MKELRGKVALVTGASRGIGVHLARALAQQGMRLVLAARSADALENVRAALAGQGAQVLVVPTDLAQADSLRALVDAAMLHFGQIDLLVNNAGLDQCQEYTEISQQFIKNVIAVNLTAPMLLSHMVLPGMIARRSGHIVNVGSLAGLTGTPYNETYSATKHGLIGFTRSLRLSLEAEGHPIGVSSICPGFVGETGMFQTMVDASGVSTPKALGLSNVDTVARAMLAAIRHDVPETIVSAVPVRPLLVLALIWPRLGERLSRMLGVVSTFRHVAAKRVNAP